MATRAQALIPITIAAVIVGIVGLAAIPDDAKLESVAFPRDVVTLDKKLLEVQMYFHHLSPYMSAFLGQMYMVVRFLQCAPRGHQNQTRSCPRETAC